MSIKKEFLEGVKWTGVSGIIVGLFQIVKIAVLTRFLDRHDFGLMAIIMLVIGFTNIFLNMGLTAAIIHFRNISKKEYNSLFWLNIFMAMFLWIAIFASSPFISNFYNEIDLQTLVPITSLNLLIVALGKIFRTIEQKNLNFQFISILDIIASSISLIVAVILAFLDFGIYSLIWSLLFSSLCVNLILFFKGVKNGFVGLKFNLSLTKPYLKIGIYQTGSLIMNYFTKELDVIIIGKTLGTEVLGLYSLSKQLVMKPVQLLNPILNKVTAPLLAKIQKDLNLVKTTYLKLVSIIAFANFPIYFLIIIAASNLISILYGEEYIDAKFLVQFLSVVYMFRALGNPIGGLVVATGRTDLEFKWNWALLMIYPIIIYFASMNGIEFMVVVLAMFRIFLNFPGWFFLINKMINVNYLEYVSSFIKPLVTSVISALLTSLVIGFVSPSNASIGLIFSSFLMLSTYVLLNIRNIKTLISDIK